MRGKKRIGQLKFGEELRRWERMREDVEFCLLENVRSYLRIALPHSHSMNYDRFAETVIP